MIFHSNALSATNEPAAADLKRFAHKAWSVARTVANGREPMPGRVRRCGAGAALIAGLMLSALSFTLEGPVQAQGAGSTSAADTRWEALLPPDWDPRKAYRGLELGALNDANPAVLARMRAAQAPLDDAPVNRKMDGAAVRLAGYVVPLDEVLGELREFLLVPTHGACIHAPPPPANQIVHVLLARPLKGVHLMDAVRVSGTLQARPTETDWGASGWQMRAPVVEPYTAPPPALSCRPITLVWPIGNALSLSFRASASSNP